MLHHTLSAAHRERAGLPIIRWLVAVPKCGGCAVVPCDCAVPASASDCVALVQEELRYAAASRETAGPYFPVGAAARLQKRAADEPVSSSLNLAHSLCGFSQLTALQVRPPVPPHSRGSSARTSRYQHLALYACRDVRTWFWPRLNRILRVPTAATAPSGNRFAVAVEATRVGSLMQLCFVEFVAVALRPTLAGRRSPEGCRCDRGRPAAAAVLAIP